MPVVFIRHIGANLAFVEPVGAVDPGFGGGRPGGVDPGYDLPAWLHPGHGLPGGGHVRPPIYHPGHPDHGLPSGGHIDNALPGAPGSPGNELPAGPPPHVPTGTVLVLVRDQAGVWHYATTAPGSPPPTTLPEPPPGTIWPKPPGVDNTLPPGTPPVAGQPLPPTPAPKK